MKKILLLLAVLPLFFSCSSSDDDSYPLSGTYWEYTYEEGGYKSVEVISFGKGDFMYYMDEWEDGSKYSQSHRGTYVYDEPNVTMSLSGETLEGIISGNKLTSTSVDGEVYVFTKK